MFRRIAAALPGMETKDRSDIGEGMNNASWNELPFMHSYAFLFYKPLAVKLYSSDISINGNRNRNGNGNDFFTAMESKNGNELEMELELEWKRPDKNRSE